MGTGGFVEGLRSWPVGLLLVAFLGAFEVWAPDRAAAAPSAVPDCYELPRDF